MTPLANWLHSEDLEDIDCELPRTIRGLIYKEIRDAHRYREVV